MRIKSAMTAAAIGALALLGAAAPAQAATNGQAEDSCNHGDNYLCLFYNSNLGGSRVGIYGQVNNYDVNTTDCSSQGCAHYDFLSSGNGQLQKVKNDAASAYNEQYVCNYGIYYNSNLSGPSDVLAPIGYGTYYGNLSVTYNENASQAACV